MNSTLYKRVKAAEKRLDELERSSGEELVTSDLIKQGVSAFKFFSTEKNYYDTSLSARANYLNAEVKQLCKTVLFENTLNISKSTQDASDSKYYCVVVQYQAKIDVDLLRDVIISMRNKNKLTRKNFNFMLAPEEVSDRLTGFKHNGVCPFGLKCGTIPVIVCRHVLEAGPMIFLGGGHPQMKLCLSTKEFETCPTVHCGGAISTPRLLLDNDK